MLGSIHITYDDGDSIASIIERGILGLTCRFVFTDDTAATFVISEDGVAPTGIPVYAVGEAGELVVEPVTLEWDRIRSITVL